MKKTTGRALATLGLLTAATGLLVPAAAAQAATPTVPGVPASVGAAAPQALGPTWNPNLCAQVGLNAGWRGGALQTAIAIGLAESGCEPGATGHNPGGSRDRGLWQINSRWHPNVTDACAYDAQCNANYAFQLSRNGTKWSDWATFNNGLHHKHMGVAADACRAVGGGC